MNLEELKNVIKRLQQHLKNNKNLGCPRTNGKLQGIKETIEAFEVHLDYYFKRYKYGATKWKEIKELLNTQSNENKKEDD